MKVRVKAKSSSGEPYNVDFIVQEGRLYVHCSCKAGMYGQLCKHKTELVAGEESRLFDVGEREKMRSVVSLISKAREVQNLAASIAYSEKLIRGEEAKLKRLKKEFGARLQEGILIEGDIK